MEATDGTGGNYLEQSFNRWFALMQVKRSKYLYKSKHERFLVLAQKLRDRWTEEDFFYFPNCISGAQLYNFHTVRNLIFNNQDRDREESIVMLYIAFFTEISVELN